MSGDPSVHQAVRRILLSDWDPSNASRFEAAHGEYDSFIAPLLALLGSDDAEEQIIDYLYDREREIMCFPGLGRGGLRRVARKLVALRNPDRV